MVDEADSWWQLFAVWGSWNEMCSRIPKPHSFEAIEAKSWSVTS